MATYGRRSPRVTLNIPLHIEAHDCSCSGHTAVVNRHGALILVPARFPEGCELEVWNLHNGTHGRARVVWYGGEDLPGLHKEGIELIDPHPAFWGSEYDELAGTSARRPPQAAN